jgi:uncharacterized protein
MSEIHATVVQLSKMLQNLDTWLVKATEYAKEKNFDPNVLVDARLAPDMYPLSRQVQSACDSSKFLASRLSGKEPPKHEDTERTIEELRARIQTVRTYLAGYSEKDFETSASRIVPLPFRPGKGLSADDFRIQMNNPNAYFHVCMAYAILRHNGVPLVKGDFIGPINFLSI